MIFLVLIKYLPPLLFFLEIYVTLTFSILSLQTSAMLETPDITVLIKAPNQKHDDHPVQCRGTWTVQQLKGHLAENYPTKPVRIPPYFCSSLSQATLDMKEQPRW